MSGYTDQVEFKPECVPVPAGGKRVLLQPETPSTTDEASTPRKGGGLMYYWQVSGSLQDVICDVHIKLPDKLDPKKLSKSAVEKKAANRWRVGKGASTRTRTMAATT